MNTPNEHEHCSVNYEPTDARPRSLIGIAFVLVVGVALLCGAAQLTFTWLSRQGPAASDNRLAVDESSRPLYTRMKDIPAPRIEGLEPVETEHPFSGEGRTEWVLNKPIHPEDLRASRQPRLQKFGWVERKEKVAHIPIDLAMKLLLEEKRLPVRAEPVELAQPPSDASSGRRPGRRQP